MAYSYQTERPRIFTEDGQIMFLKIRDQAKRLITEAGVARLENVIKGVPGDVWQMMACVDRLVELGELREITQAGYVAGQDRLFVAGRR